MKRELIVTSEGSFIKPIVEKRELGLDYISDSLKALLERPIKISNGPVKLNKHGGYVGNVIKANIKKFSDIKIDPSAIVGDGASLACAARARIGKNCIVGAGTEISHDVEIEFDTIIGEGNHFAEHTKIGPWNYIGNNNVIHPTWTLIELYDKDESWQANSVFKHEKFGHYVIIGDNNDIWEDTRFGDRTIIGNNNKFHSGVIINFDNFIGNNCVFKEKAQTANGDSYQDNCQLGVFFRSLGRSRKKCFFEKGFTAEDFCTIHGGCHFRKNVKLGVACEFDTDISVGENCIFGTNVKVDMEALIGAKCRIGDCAQIGLRAWIDDKAKIPYNKKIKPRTKKIGPCKV